MVKVEVIENFSLGKYSELKNIARKSYNQEGYLYVGDIFECTEDMTKYLTGNNGFKRAFVKVLEVIPEVKEEVKAEKEEKKPAKKTTTKRKTTTKKVAKK